MMVKTMVVIKSIVLKKNRQNIMDLSKNGLCQLVDTARFLDKLWTDRPRVGDKHPSASLQ